MKTINNKLYKSVALGFATSMLIYSCAKFETREFFADKPQSLIDQEKLDAYNELKSYVNYSNQSNFKLGAELSLADLTNNTLLYRTLQPHFDEIGLTGIRHFDYVTGEGAVDLANLHDALLALENTGLSAHVGHLLWHSNQQANYLNSLVADIIIPGEAGTDVVVDFENNALGDSYPQMGGGSNVIVNDPTGKSGKTLNMKGAQTFPQFQITLPEGRKLGDYKSVSIDFKGDGCCGLYGAGMRMAITTAAGSVTLINYNSPAGYGAPGGEWARGVIILPLSTLNLTNTQKELTSFVLTVGSATGSADYLMDNVSMQWEKIGQTIVKTPEEKAEIFTEELDKWIKGAGEAGKDHVKSWSVAYQPIDEVNTTELRTGIGQELPANTFYWQDYLGKDYAAIAIEKIKQYGNPEAKIFFTETNLADNPAKIQGLLDFITYTESKGTPVDGIATELALNITADKSKIESMLQALAQTGKLIKISALDIGIGVPISQANATLYQQQADMYQWFVESYNSIIPANQRAGITFRSPLDRSGSDTWRANEPVGLWTNTTSYLRKLAYEAIVKAFGQ